MVRVEERNSKFSLVCRRRPTFQRRRANSLPSAEVSRPAAPREAEEQATKIVTSKKREHTRTCRTAVRAAKVTESDESATSSKSSRVGIVVIFLRSPPLFLALFHGVSRLGDELFSSSDAMVGRAQFQEDDSEGRRERGGCEGVHRARACSLASISPLSSSSLTLSLFFFLSLHPLSLPLPLCFPPFHSSRSSSSENLLSGAGASRAVSSILHSVRRPKELHEW